MSVRKKQPAKRTSKATAKSAAGARKRSTGKKATAKPAKAKRSKSAPKASKKKAKARPTQKKGASDKKLKAKAAQAKAAQAKAAQAKAAQAKAKEKLNAQKQKERERAEKEREKARVEKERERAKKEQQRQKEQAQREKEREKAQREKEREAARKAKLKQQEEKQRAREKELKEREKKKEQERRDAERARLKKEAEAKREAEKAAKEAERLQRIAERDAEREALRKAKEEERARREAEREAYRKAKEAERERLRAEREAAKRLREGKVARATKAAQRVDGLRVGTTRVYDPAAIPNQSGTSRRHGEPDGPPRLVGVRPPDLGRSGEQPHSIQPESSSASDRPKQPTPPPPPVTESIEQRQARIVERLAQAGDALRREYEETLEMSWIHHDSALEGVVYTFQELKTAIDPTLTVVPDSSMQPVCEEIRRHRQAIAYTRDLGERRRVPLNVDVVKKLFVILHPEEGDVKSVKYRKDIPQHRLYFHEYAAPDKIAYRVRQVMDWLNGPEAKKTKNPVRVAARVHYDLLRVFPFAQDSGKVCRLLMNIILMRGGYPPAIIHSTERQRYYEALKGQLPVIIQLVNESILNSLASIEKRLDEHDAK
jgi:Fic family protein